jgi:hypothetical protein
VLLIKHALVVSLFLPILVWIFFVVPTLQGMPCVQAVTGEVELEAKQDGMKIELQSFVSPAGWAKPRLQIGFKF